MKRAVLPLLLVIFSAAAGFYLLKRFPPHEHREAADLLPANTLILEEMPNLHRTQERWPQTALAQIINEPDLQAFLARPLSQLPFHDELDKRLGQLKAIDPSRFFLGVTEWSGSGAPLAVAGLSYAGDRAQVDSLVSELRREAQQTWPEGKSDIQKYGAGEIETFATPAFTAALAYRGEWVFIATDIALLKATLDRFDASPAPDSLGQQADFKKCLQHLPDAADNILYLRPDLLADKVETLAMMLNPTGEIQQGEQLKQTRAWSVGFKMDGLLMRDAGFAIQPPAPDYTTPLARDAFRLSTPDTILAIASRLPQLGAIQLPDAKADPTGTLAMFEGWEKAFTDRGLGLKQFNQAFGPEGGFLLDWPAGFLSYPGPLVMMDVRDTALARKFLDTLPTVDSGSGAGFTRQDKEGITYYTLPFYGGAIPSLQLTLGLTDKCLIGALASTDSVTQAAKRLNSPASGLTASPDYQKAAALVQSPSVSFTYLDSKPIFERLYGMVSSVAAIGLIPHISDYVDVAKLPNVATISRHLSPIVSSDAYNDGGLTWESAGPVTSTQASILTGGLMGAAAVPLVMQQLNGQSGFSIPGFPGFSPSGSGGSGNSFASPLTPGNSSGQTPPPPPAATPSAATPAPATGTP